MDDIKDISNMLDTSFSLYIVAQNLLHATSTFKAGWETYLHTVAIYFAKNQAPIVRQPEKKKKKNLLGQTKADASFSHIPHMPYSPRKSHNSSSYQS